MIEERVERFYDREVLTKAQIAEIRQVLHDEIHRIDTERADARRVIDRSGIRYTDLTETIEQALDLADNHAVAYRQASPRVRRLLNQAFFDRIDVNEQEVIPTLSQAYQRLRDIGNAPSFSEAVDTEHVSRIRYQRAGSRPDPSQQR